MANEIQELKFQVGEAWKGVYSSSTAYSLANVVQDSTGLSVYRSLKSGNVGHPVSDASWWFRIIDMSSIKAESDRIKALNDAIAEDEALRVAAEELRQQKEQQRIAAETQRDEAEQARINTEQQRVTKETQREANEQQRINAEQGRVSAESARVQAEQARVLAETLRANAEDQRAANEQNRVAAEQQRIERAEQDHQRAESDHAAYVDSLGAFDISSYHAIDGVLAKYADLAAALGTNGANIPDDLRKGGMSVKFVQSSDNMYVQYRCMANAFSTTITDWQGVNEAQAVDDNLMTSRGIISSDCDFSRYGIISVFNVKDFVNGGLSNGVLTNQKYRVSSNLVKYTDRYIHLQVKEGFKFAIYLFSDQNTFSKDLGWKTGEYCIAPGYYKLLIARVSESTSEIADILEFVSAITIKSETLIGLNIQNGNIPLYYELGNATANNGEVVYSYSVKRARLAEGYYLNLTAGYKIVFTNDGSSHFYLLTNQGEGWSSINPTSDEIVIENTCKVIIVVVGTDTQTDASYLSGLISIIPPFGIKNCQERIKHLEDEVSDLDNEVSDIENKVVEHISNVNLLDSYKISPSSSRYGFKFPVICDTQQVVSVLSGFKVSCVFSDSSGSTIVDSGWLDSVELDAPHYAIECTIMFRTDPSGTTDWNTIIGGIEDIGLNVLKNRALTTFKNVLIDNVALGNFVAKTSFKNICHQGYSDSDITGRNIAKNYIAAANKGFNYGETDIYFSSDNVLMCCHDSSFEDSVSGVTINIAEHTAAELKGYNYYGDHISTLDEVVAACKSVGIGLVLDHTGYINYDFDNRFNSVFAIIKKYKFEDYVEWYVNEESLWDSFTSKILTWYSKSKICISGTMTMEGAGRAIVKANSLVNEYNSISLNLDHSKFSVAEIQEINAQLKPGIGVELWTINAVNNFKAYKPYITGITSNKINEYFI